MGKLLQKIVHGIVPSWLARAKSLPKMLLPPVTSIKSSPSNNSRDHDRSDRSSNNEVAAPATACVESSCSVDSATPPPSTEHKKTNMQQNDGMHEHTDNDDNHHCHSNKIHQFEGNNDRHHLPHADMDDCSHGIRIPATQIYVPNQQEDEGIQDENHPPQHRYHRYNVGLPSCNHVLLGSEKRSLCIQCKQEDNNSHHHQKDQSGYHEQPNAKHKRSYVGSKREIGCAQEDNHKDHVHEAHIGYDAEQKNHRRDLVAFKRKSRYSEEDKDEEETRGGSGDSSMRGWGGKRRKREEGLMSCELPESVCGVVGNAKAVVKYSQEPQHAMWESMVEMIVGNGLCELGSLEFLLFCYLSLNEPHLHSIIQSSFLQVLKDLERTF